ncbi:hypothetical protein [Croceicoccus bisphenolivorans]|uniref:hypothetical protein n=1 Tax=Croceicoccus bisphenolivorans TaxID=1783232 RepID=UPI000837308A|nr:hypothetical protein [Croceicoccus bisphenolivorans]
MLKVKPRMMLELVEYGPHTGPVVMVLHDAEGHPDQLADLAADFAGLRLIIPRAPRWASMRGPGLFSWFTAIGDSRFDPVTFGDSLTQLELLLLSTGQPKIGAVGIGQGATILCALCALWPERFDWIELRGGHWPELGPDLLPHRSMDGLQVLIHHGGGDSFVDPTPFAARGALVASPGTAITDFRKHGVAGIVLADRQAGARV